VEIIVGGRFNGPAGSGNGGYTCGLVAGAVGLAPAEVTLRRPPPLDVPLRIDGQAVLDGDALVAEAAGAIVEVTPPPFPGYDAARAAEQRYAGLRDHPYPTCFVCGPKRDDGLGLRTGPVGEAFVACTWTPAADLSDDGGKVRDEFVWAALDCPGAWALMQTDESPMMLGRLAVNIQGSVRPGMPYVVTGWRHAPREGRKNYAGTAVYDAAGTLLATGRSTWITLQSGGGS
jgi:hypothetical protein